MHKLSNIMWGIVLITLGVVFGLNILGITDINIFFSGWWTLFIIVPCFINLFVDEHKGGNLVGLLIGVCLFLACQDILDMALVWKMIVPACLVIAGLAIIFQGSLKGSAVRKARQLSDQRTDADQKEYWATFSEQILNYDGEKFTGCKMDAVFGGVKCNLERAKIEDGAVIVASSIFGGITIYVPEEIEVEVASTSIFGGVSDKRRNRAKTVDAHETEDIEEAEVVGEEKKTQKKSKKKTLYIDATCLFGGLEIR